MPPQEGHLLTASILRWRNGGPEVKSPRQVSPLIPATWLEISCFSYPSARLTWSRRLHWLPAVGIPAMASSCFPSEFISYPIFLGHSVPATLAFPFQEYARHTPTPGPLHMFLFCSECSVLPSWFGWPLLKCCLISDAFPGHI